MKLNITPKELLALYNVLYERFDGVRGVDLCNYKADDPAATDAVQLKQVYNRLRACLLAGLTAPGTPADPVDAWLKNEGEKVSALEAKNEQLKEIGKDPTKLADLATILADDDDEIPKDLSYPARKKGPPPPHKSFHPGKHKAKFSHK